MRSSACVLTLLALCAGGSSAVDAQELDSGQLQVNEGGRRVGVERFRVWRAGGTVNAVANVELARGVEWRVAVQLSPDLLPLKYELQGEGAPRVSGERFSDRVRFHTVSDDGERWKEFPTRTVEVVLEDGVAHHYLVLVLVLREAPDGQASVVIPSRGESVVARLARESSDQVSVEERSVAATRYDVEVGGAPRSVWLDAAGRLLRVLDPGSGREAVRVSTG